MLDAFVWTTSLLSDGRPTGGGMSTSQNGDLLRVSLDESRDSDMYRRTLMRLVIQRDLILEEYAIVAGGMDAPTPVWVAGALVLAEACAAGPATPRRALASPGLHARRAALLGHVRMT